MKTSIASRRHTARRSVAAASATALIAALTLSQTAFADEIQLPAVPDDLRPPPGNVAFLKGAAIGTQNYACTPQGTGFAWVLFTPEATLFNNVDKQSITHFFGPNPQEPNSDPRVVSSGTIRAAWQHRDTSTVWARVFPLSQPSFDPRFVRPNSVPWLLLDARGVQEGPNGGDTLTRTTFIQRVNTDGGVAPATGCSQASDVGKKAFIPYTADYFFFTDESTGDND